MSLKKKITVKRIVIFFCLIVFVGYIIYSSIPKPVPVLTATAERGSISTYVEEKGRTTLPHIYHVTMPLNGRIRPITLEEGTPVSKDQEIAQMDIDNLQTTLEQTNYAIDAFDDAVAASEAKTFSSKAVEEYQKWLSEGQQALYYPAKLVSEMTVKDAETKYVQAHSTYLQDQLTYNALKAFDAAIALIQVFTMRDLDRAIIVSPIDGVVLKRHVADEQVLQAGQRLLDIGNLSQLQITADILSEDAINIKPGDSVDIYGIMKTSGKVLRVEPQGFTKISSLGVEQQRVPVKIVVNKDDMAKIQESGRNLGVEYRVHVRIYTATKNNVVKIPRTALFRGQDNKWEVFAVSENKAKIVTVDIGLINDTEAEVTNGLSDGDIVILAPETTLEDGTRITPEIS